MYKPISSILLTGWEYNTLLDPKGVTLSSKASALPSSAFWGSGALFWLFRKVYCTKQAFEGEYKAGYNDRLQWTTGRIFTEMVDLPHIVEKDPRLSVLSPITLSDQPQSIRSEIEDNAAELKEYVTREYLYDLLKGADHTELERIKLKLFAPICRDKNCIVMPSPNAITKFFGSGVTSDAPRPGSPIRLLADPIIQFSKFGYEILPSPKRIVTESQFAAQQHEENRVQKPLIPQLFLGELEMDEYHDELIANDSSVYQPINKGFADAWKVGKEILIDLRAAAERHLWYHLHNDWLPSLYDPSVNSSVVTGRIDAQIREVMKVVESQHGSDFSKRVYSGAVKLVSLVAQVGALHHGFSGPQSEHIAGMTNEMLKKGQPFFTRPIFPKQARDQQQKDLVAFYQEARHAITKSASTR